MGSPHAQPFAHVLKGDGMALKVYVVNGATFQFEEGNQPDGAVEYVPELPPGPVAKSVGKPANKQAGPRKDK